jgi:hypothetical protein
MLNFDLLVEEILNEVRNSKNILEILKFNIESNMTCRIYYKSKNTKNAGWRTIEPYALGIHRTSDNQVLRAVQLTRTASDTPNGKPQGPTRTYKYTRLPNGWRMFRLSGILDIKSGVGKFIPSKKSEYNVNDKDMKKIIVAVGKEKKRSDNYVQNIDN